jgi:hypothetical protein
MTGSLFQGNRTQASAAQMVTDALNAIAGEQTALTAATTAGSGTVFAVTAGTGTLFSVDATIVQATSDTWVVRVGHDRAPRFIRLFNGATATYTNNVSLAQGSNSFEPLGVNVTDEDATTFYNRILVYGNTNPATGQPYSAIVIDDASVGLIGRYIDGAPVTNTSLNTDAACATYGRQLLDQYSIGAENVTLRVYTDSNGHTDQMPQGLASGDVVRGVDCVTITGFEGSGTPNVYGLASSVVTTLDFVNCTSYQDVTFAASAIAAVQSGMIGANVTSW